MWEQYKKTFFGMQAVIAMVCYAAYLLFYRKLAPTLMFFAILQVGAAVGAFWATQLKKRFQNHV